MKEPVIRLGDISFTYNSDKNAVLKTISMEIKKGSVTGILGPNGVGKTTLLHVILGWNKPDSGTVELAGKNIGSYSRREMGKLIGLVPQYEHISFEYSLVEYVLLGRTPHLPTLQSPSSEDYRIAVDALKTVGLDRIAGKSVTRLSGGEKQLVLVARSIAQNPSILLMDEPMSNLDLANKIRLLDVMRTLNRQGVTILFTTHEPELAASIADSMILMGEGNLVCSGSSEEIINSESLSKIYGIPVEVDEYKGRKILIWHK